VAVGIRRESEDTLTIDVICPTCAAISYFDELNRDASAFCRVCDYPLFWAGAGVRGEAGNDVDADAGLRRLPGTVGRKEVATISCPACAEPNPVSGKVCIRCGAELRPRPVPVPVVTPPPPPPPPEPPPPEPAPPRVVWPWVVAALAAAAAVIAIVAFLVWG
jgi:hypothetical protein